MLGRDICFNFGRQVKFQRGSIKKIGRQAKKWAGSIKNAAKKILAPAAKKEKNMGADFNNAPAGDTIIPRGFF